MASSCWILFFVSFLCYVYETTGTGRMVLPPQRSSLWRDPIHKTNPLVIKNHQDHTLNCGGLWKQKQNGGRCGVCGDAWDIPVPRPNEAGGTYGRGIIGRTYYPADRFIPIKIQVLSPIDGYFEFKVCPNNNVRQRVTQECLDKNPLKIYSHDRWTSYGTRYYPNLAPNKPVNISLALEIPTGLTCTQCVLQWKWRGGNNWGKCRNGTAAVGCGAQVEFYNCADIAILGAESSRSRSMQQNRAMLANAMKRNMQSTNVAASQNAQNNPVSSKMLTSNEVVMSNALKRELQALSRPNAKSSTILNGVLARASPNPMTPLGMTGGMAELSNLLKSQSMAGSQPTPNNPLYPLWASVFGRGRMQPFDSSIMSPLFKNKLIQTVNREMSSSRSGFRVTDNLLNRALLTTLLGRNPENQTASSTSISNAGRKDVLDRLLLQMALNPNVNIAEYIKLLALVPIMRRDLGTARKEANKTMSMQMQNQTSANFSSPALTQARLVPDEQNYLQQLLMSQYAAKLLPSLAGTGAGTMSGRGGEEASEGGSRPPSNLAMNIQLPLIAALLGENRPSSSTPSSFLAPLLSRSEPNMFGTQSLRPMLSGSMPRNEQMMFSPELMVLSSLLGRNRRGGGEASEGGGEPGLFGSAFGRGGGGGERSESQGSSMGGNFAKIAPLLTHMLGQNLGMGGRPQSQMPIPPIGTTGLGLPGAKPMNLPSMLLGGSMAGNVPSPAVGSMLGRKTPVGPAAPLSVMPVGLDGLGRNQILGSSLMRGTNLVPGSRSPQVSLLDLYRLMGSLGGRRNTRRID